MKLLSIIIPAFNIEKYLSVCLDSILRQMNNDIEIIIINDGSTDNTGDIADNYTEQYGFIKVIHQSNQGVSAARNKGLVEATGDYVWFVDGDDLVANKAVPFLIHTIQQYPTEIILFKYKTFFDQSVLNEKFEITGSDDFKIKNFSSDLFNLLKDRVLSYSPCDKVVKRQLLLDNEIIFDINIISAEDYYWNYQVFKYTNTYIDTGRVLYLYRKNRAGSATTLISHKHLYSALYALEVSIKDINSYFAGNFNYKNFLLYSSQLFFYNLPEFHRSGLINKELENRFHTIYKLYKNNGVELSEYNSGAKTFEQIYSRLLWNYTIRIYSQLISLKRYIQISILKKTT